MGWHYVDWKSLPDCCKGCTHHDWDSKDEYSPSYHYCTQGLIIPTGKKTCKRMKK